MIRLFFEGSFNLASQLLNPSGSLLSYTVLRTGKPHYLLCTTTASNSRYGNIRRTTPFSKRGWLLVELGMVMMVPMMVMVMHDYHNLSLRRIGYCKAKKENQTDPELVHTLL
jgi:hypothetical protein